MHLYACSPPVYGINPHACSPHAIWQCRMSAALHWHALMRLQSLRCTVLTHSNSLYARHDTYPHARGLCTVRFVPIRLQPRTVCPRTGCSLCMWHAQALIRPQSWRCTLLTRGHSSYARQEIDPRARSPRTVRRRALVQTHITAVLKLYGTVACQPA